jgi:transcriptional regulator with XRE-family HTH domain
MTKEERRNLARNLVRRRERFDISQAALAARAGVSIGTVADLEKQRRVPKWQTLEYLAGALGCAGRPEMLLGRKGKTP